GALAYVAGPRVLELGFGAGVLLADGSRYGWQMVGIDPSPQMHQQAARRLARQGQRALLVQGVGEALPFAGGSFDTVLATFPAEYILRPATLAECARVLRAGGGGRLVIVGVWVALEVGGRQVRGPVFYGRPSAEAVAAIEGRMADAGFSVQIQEQADGIFRVAIITAEPPSQQNGKPKNADGGQARRPIGPSFSLEHTHLAEARHEVGNGRVMATGAGVRLALAANDGARYHNAQLDDYYGSGAPHFRWYPPLRLRVQARFSHDADGLHGTAGFGFWNDPFAMTGSHAWRLPRSLWFFFGSPPNNLPLAMGVPGHGWKAATLDAKRWSAVALAPAAPLGMLLMRSKPLYRLLWPEHQRILHIGEALVPARMDEWHEYEIIWEPGRTTFRVDGSTLLALPFAPGGPMGLVVWIDNQYMVATPQGRFRHGLLATGDQWLELKELTIRTIRADGRQR
ncbi:MAG TPA: class I SAM-dependent methyltransferase, partial [Caldilineaceae bacterium]|nr:class I SAM-dependent methyltransferase [Caldilineaceae bacterium]